MTKGLLDEKPLIIIPSLAVKIGLNESIILQQMHYWMQSSNHNHENRKWIYNSYEGWQVQFPFLSIATIRRTIDNLVKLNLIVKGNFNKMGIDRTIWYSINYDNDLLKMSSPCAQNEQMHMLKMSRPTAQNEQTNNQRLTTENNHRLTKKKYKESVYLSDDELKALQEKYGNDTTEKAIEKLDNYKGSTGKRYKSDYKAILNWVIDSLTTKKGNSKKEVLPDWYTGQSTELDQVEIEKEKQRLKELMERDDGQNQGTKK